MGNNYEHLGGGRYDVYRPKKESPWPGILGAIVVLIILGAIFG